MQKLRRGRCVRPHCPKGCSFCDNERTGYLLERVDKDSTVEEIVPVCWDCFIHAATVLYIVHGEKAIRGAPVYIREAVLREVRQVDAMAG